MHYFKCYQSGGCPCRWTIFHLPCSKVSLGVYPMSTSPSITSNTCSKLFVLSKWRDLFKLKDIYIIVIFLSFHYKHVNVVTHTFWNVVTEGAVYVTDLVLRSADTVTLACCCTTSSNEKQGTSWDFQELRMNQSTREAGLEYQI